MEARTSLNKALEAVEKEKEEQNAIVSEEDIEEEEERELEEEAPQDKKTQIDKKPKIKTEAIIPEEDNDDIDDEDYIPKVKEPKLSSKLQQKQPPQASYIMKLFDRSVNLAKFEEDTPLYPLCRAWMKNQPRAVSSIKSEKSNEADIQTAEEGDVVEMPKVRIRKSKTSSTRTEVKINKKDFDKHIDSETWTKVKLLEFHRSRWMEEKLKQLKISRSFEEKFFAANLELLETLMKEE